MKLISLKLLNYRRFTQEEVFFPDNFSIIFWKNGSGKSSIFDAIWLCLFGPKWNDFVRVNRSELKSHFLTWREPSKVELIFEYGMDEYRIVRVIDPGINKLASEFIVERKDTLFWPHWLEIIGWDEITDFIEKLLGVNKNIFLRSVFTKQKDLEVLSWGLSERKALIQSVLGLDRLETLIEELKKTSREQVFALEAYKKKAGNIDIDFLESEKKSLWEVKKEVGKSRDEKKKELKTFETNFQEIKKIYEAEGKRRDLFVTYKKDIEVLQTKIDGRKKSLQDFESDLWVIEKNEALLKTMQEIPEKLKQDDEKAKRFEAEKHLFTQLTQLQKEKTEEEKKQESLEKEFQKFSQQDYSDTLKELEKNMTSLEELYQSLQKEIVQITAEQTHIEQEGKSLKDELSQFQTLWEKSNCPTCKRPLEKDFPKLIFLFEKEIQEKRALYGVLQNKKLLCQKDGEEKQTALLALKTEVSRTQQEEKEFILLKNKKEHSESQLKLLQQKIEDLGGVVYDEEEHTKFLKDYEASKQSYALYQKLLWMIEKKSEILSKREQTQKILEEENVLIEQLKQKIESLNYLEEIYLEIKWKYHTQDEGYQLILRDLSALEKQFLEVDYKQKQILAQLEEYQNLKKEIESYVQNLSKNELKKNIISSYIVYLLGALKPQIEFLASEYFSLITDGKYTSLELDDEYSILIDGRNIDFYSGGEKDLANLCLRLALGQNMTAKKGNPINFLVLDEVLSSQDTSRQQNILYSLSKLSSKFSQILLISHLDEVKDLANNLIEVRQKDKHESEVIVR